MASLGRRAKKNRETVEDLVRHQQAKGESPEPQPPKDDTPPEPSPAETPPEPPAEPAKATEPSAPEPKPTEPQPGPKASEPAIPSRKGEGEESAETWKQKYQVIRGKYDAEVPRLHRENRELRAENERLKEQATRTPETPAPTPAADSQTLAKIREDYGDEMADQLGQVIQAEVDRRTGPLESRIASSAETVEQFMERSRQQQEDAYYDSVYEKVPDFDRLNNDRTFNDWIRQTKEPYSGKSLYEILQEAHERLDADTVIKVFRGYTPQGQSASGQGAAELIEPQRAAGGSPTSDAPQGGEQKTWTRKEIEQEQQEIFRGAIKGKGKYAGPQGQEDAQRVRQEIAAAINEGRVRD